MLRNDCDVHVSPIVNEEWWNANVIYSRFRRQGIDIICASFQHKLTSGSSSGRANIIFLTGLTESFIKYSETIQYLFNKGFNVFTYDHQSQGLSGRWLAETQSLWIHSFEDYVDDFVYFVTTIAKEYPTMSTYLLAHSMGGLIASIAMSRQPTLINRAVLCAPMFRNKCGMKALDFRYPMPQPLAYWITSLMCYAGFGTRHAVGFFKEKQSDKLHINVVTSDQLQLDKWRALRCRYPQLVSTCVTNDWVLHSIRAQKKFATRYEFVRTNTLVLSAERDLLVYNRALQAFVSKAPASRLLEVPGAYHELLFEAPAIREAVLRAVSDFFSQRSDDVKLLQAPTPLQEPHRALPFSWPEVLFRAAGVMLASAGIVAGIALMVGGRGRHTS